MLGLATGVLSARSFEELRAIAEPALMDLIGASSVRLSLSETYLAPHLDLTGPLLRIPLEHQGRTCGALEVKADATRLTQSRPTAERVAVLIAARVSDLRSRPGPQAEPDTKTLAEALDDLKVPLAITATADGTQVWRNRTYLTQPPPAAGDGPDVVVAVGSLAVASWGSTAATELRAVLDRTLSAPHPAAILRPVHDGRGGVTRFETAWSNRSRPELGGIPVERALRSTLTQALRTQTPTKLTGEEIVPPRPLLAGLDITIAPLGDAIVCTWRPTSDPGRAGRGLEDREQLFRTALDAALDPVTIAVPVNDDDGDPQDFELVWCNRAHLAAGAPGPGSSMVANTHAMPTVDIVDAHRQVHDTGEPMVLDDVRVEFSDEAGELVEAFVDVGITRFGSGLLTSYRPATERIKARQDLLENERLFRGVFDEAPRGMLLYSLDESCLGRCLRVNPAFSELSGYTEQEYLDGGWPLVVTPDEVERTEQLFADMAAGRLHRRRLEGHLRTAAGTVIDVQADCSVVTRAGRPGYCVVHLEDITERRRAESEVSWLAMHDSRTGLPNRHLFLHQVRHALGRLERRPGSVAVLSVVVRDDLDDAALEVVHTEVARRLTDAVRRSDTPARIGGSDFAVLLPEIGGPEAARRLSRRVMDALAEDVPIPDGDRSTSMRAFVGLSFTGDADADAVQLVRNARLDAVAHSQVVEARQRNV